MEVALKEADLEEGRFAFEATRWGLGGAGREHDTRKWKPEFSLGHLGRMWSQWAPAW